MYFGHWFLIISTQFKIKADLGVTVSIVVVIVSFIILLLRHKNETMRAARV